jgi:CheY-like chemotaxis protein
VIDTGIGIAADKLNTVFHEFTRLDEGAREADGLGLGLSIVDRIARVLRLELRIFSSPGKGTRFSVILPVAAVQPRREVEAKAPVRTAASLAGLRVLCIDNDARILDGMRLLLEGWGCSVDTFAGSGDLKGSVMHRPDIVLADYHLDGETGLDAIVKLRAIHGQDMPAVLVTADRSSEVRATAGRLDVPVINKPLKPAVLRSMMARVRPLASAAE